MKKYVFLLLASLACSCGLLRAQDCRAIVAPHFNNNLEVVDEIPYGKLFSLCAFSRHSFFVTDEVPAGATVYNISQVKVNTSQNYLPESFVVDLNTLSFYAYNFNEFQKTPWGMTVYFRTPGSTHSYLGLRSYTEAMTLAEQEDNQRQLDELQSRNQ